MQLQLHLVDLEEVRRKASDILKRESSNQEEAAQTDSVDHENPLSAEIKDHQRAINVEILKLVNRQKADILKLVNRHKALRSRAKATKTKFKAADKTVMNTLVVQTIREHAYVQPEEKQVETNKGDASQASTEVDHVQPPQALVSKITPQVADKIRKLVRARLTESVARTKDSNKANDLSSGDSEQIDGETVSALKSHDTPKRSGGGVTKRIRKRASQGDSRLKTSLVASDSSLNLKSHQTVLKRKKLISNLLGKKNRTLNKSFHPKHSIAGSSKAKQEQTSRRPKASHREDPQSHIPISALQSALKKIRQGPQAATASSIRMLHARTALKSICRKAQVSFPIPSITSVSSAATAPVQASTQQSSTATTLSSQTPIVSSLEAPTFESSTPVQKLFTSEQKPSTSETKQTTLELKSSTKSASKLNVTIKPEPLASVSEPNSSAAAAIPTKPKAQPTQAEIVPPSTDLKTLLSSLKTVPKGLNLPVLEFLKVNFPALRLDTLGDIMQVNNMLTKTLQMQQQVLQSQETLARKSLLPGAFDGINTQPGATAGGVASLTTPPAQAIGPVPVSVDQSISSPGQSGPPASNAGKTPVMVQIIKTAEVSFTD